MTVPLHCGVAGTAVSVMPAGSVSVNPSGCCCGLPAPLVIVNVSVVGVLTMAGDGPIVFVSVVPRTFNVSFRLVARSPAARPVMFALVVL